MYGHRNFPEISGGTSSGVRSSSGFSLIELAIGLVIIGLIMGPMMALYNAKIKQDSILETKSALAKIESGINQFFMAGNGRYPCPASFILREGDAAFGAEGDCTLGNIRLCNNPTWRTNEGICKTDNSPDAVIIGAVPFDALNLSPESVLDYWGNKIVYAVTHQQTDIASFQSHPGSIRIRALEDNVSTEIDVSANPVDLFLASFGHTGLGTYTKDGILAGSCGLATGYESENCDFDSEFFNDIHPDFSGQGSRSEVAGATYYDDITRFQIDMPEAMWFPHPDKIDHLMTLSTRVGVGTEDPQETVDVRGVIRADGNVKSDTVCDESEGSCFDPELITGDMAQMRCATAGSQGVIRIAENRVRCAAPLDSDGNPIDGEEYSFDDAHYAHTACGTGELIKGFDSDGEPICQLPVTP